MFHIGSAHVFDFNNTIVSKLIKEAQGSKFSLRLGSTPIWSYANTRLFACLQGEDAS
jgi:hypothetical protein